MRATDNRIDYSNKRILIANRGEIAIRIARAAAELSMIAVAIYTHEDRFSQHRYKTNEAFQIGPDDQALKPYLDISTIINLAVRENIDIIHPGYGFLSEDNKFVEACEKAGIIFVGPTKEIISKLGDKIIAKQIARKLKIPVIEGIEVEEKLGKEIFTKAKKIGYPLMIKAAGGGGGRGMRLANDEKQLKALIKEARNEADKAFGNPTIFIEKFINSPKHIEVQLLGDNHGDLIHLYERDCSVQRRFQKIIEVAPASSINEKTRQKLFKYALAIGKHLNYNNAGTVEFLLDKNENIFFIEVNPRVQVEHTITEEVTGIDIVRTQILVALGNKLHSSPINIPRQEDVKCNGAALQCRVTTEDPSKNFMPDYGIINAYRSAGGYGIRLDESGIYSGLKISPYFDPMIVKVSAKGRTLIGACQRMIRALKEIRIRGVNTNIGFLIKVLSNSEFQSNLTRVSFIVDNPDLLEIKPFQDSATKIITYLGEVNINGNSDIKNTDKNKLFTNTKLPKLDPFAPIPTGSRDKLLDIGRDAFCQWLRNERIIQYTDTTLRDAHQSLIATRLRTIDMLKIAPYYAHNASQIFSLEVWGGATFDVCLRFLKEDPWERLKLLRKAIPNILFQMLFRGANGVGYSAYPNNLIESFIEKSAENGIDIFRIFDSLNWLKSMENSIKFVVNNTDKIVEASICYTGDILDPTKTKYNLQYYLDLAKQLEDMGTHILGIKDMAGLITPYSVELLISRLKETVSIPIHLHTHDTSGIQSATYLKAVEAGVDAIDVAISSMSGLTSQPNFNSIVNALKFHQRHNPIDIEQLNDISDYFEVIREYYYTFESELRSGTASVYQNEIPGGQYSNLRPQARALGLEDEFADVKKNYINANKLLGNIVKVTPSSKVVGDLALFLTTNKLSPEDVIKKGSDISFPDSVISYFKGDLGQPFGGFPTDIQKIILKDIKPYNDLPNKHLSALDVEEEFELFKQKFNNNQSYLDFLSYMLYPKVFEDYFNHQQLYGDVYKIPTINFFYGLTQQNLIIVELDHGKDICIEFVYAGPIDEEGHRDVLFKLNGVARVVRIRDKSVDTKYVENQKIDPTNSHHIGAPLQGKIIDYFVNKNDKVKLNQPLFSIEAMKMETTVTAIKSGKVVNIHQQTGKLVHVDDLIITIE